MFPLFGSMVLFGLGVACLIMMLFWLLDLGLKNGTLLEIGRAFGVILLSGIYLGMRGDWNLQKEILFSMLFLWGLRLSFFLFTTRVLGRPEEGRYKRLRAKWKDKAEQKFLYLFQVQASSVVIFSLPVLVVALGKNGGFGLLEMAGFTLWCLGFFGEAIADGQLHRFRLKRANGRKVCREGLWKYSRHPNYFFEWVLWCGIALFALAWPLGWIALACPAAMYLLLTRVTGIPVNEEEALRTRGPAYQSYQRSTSPFFLKLQK